MRQCPIRETDWGPSDSQRRLRSTARACCEPPAKGRTHFNRIYFIFFAYEGSSPMSADQGRRRENRGSCWDAERLGEPQEVWATRAGLPALPLRERGGPDADEACELALGQPQAEPVAADGVGG